MPLIILGLLVVIGLTAYVLFSEHPQWFVRRKRNDTKKDSSVIYLPKDDNQSKNKDNNKS